MAMASIEKRAQRVARSVLSNNEEERLFLRDARQLDRMAQAKSRTDDQRARVQAQAELLRGVAAQARRRRLDAFRAILAGNIRAFTDERGYIAGRIERKQWKQEERPLAYWGGHGKSWGYSNEYHGAQQLRWALRRFNEDLNEMLEVQRLLDEGEV